MAVSAFTGKNRYLSNFWPVAVEGPGGFLYPTVEHAYQASKTCHPQEWAAILKMPTPGMAKRAGRKVTLREDWDTIKLERMESLLRQKFAIGTELAERLYYTDGEIAEGNYWHDTYWGVSAHTGEGFNHLGRILMKIRDELRKQL